MTYVIGQIFEEIYPPEAAEWCNENNAFMEEIEAVEREKEQQFLVEEEQKILVKEEKNLIQEKQESIINGEKIIIPAEYELIPEHYELIPAKYETRKVKAMVRRFEIKAIPEPTEEELAKQALMQAKQERADAVSNIKVTVDSMTFDGDEISQERMSRTITAGLATGAKMSNTTTWVLAGNIVAEVSLTQLATALRLAGEAQTALWTKPYEAI